MRLQNLCLKQLIGPDHTATPTWLRRLAFSVCISCSSRLFDSGIDAIDRLAENRQLEAVHNDIHRVRQHHNLRVTIKWIRIAAKCVTLLHWILWLSNGEYPSIIHRLFRFRLVPVSEDAQRSQLSFELMNQLLSVRYIWQFLTQFADFFHQLFQLLGVSCSSLSLTLRAALPKLIRRFEWIAQLFQLVLERCKRTIAKQGRIVLDSLYSVSPAFSVMLWKCGVFLSNSVGSAWSIVSHCLRLLFNRLNQLFNRKSSTTNPSVDSSSWLCCSCRRVCVNPVVGITLNSGAESDCRHLHCYVCMTRLFIGQRVTYNDNQSRLWQFGAPCHRCGQQIRGYECV